MPLRVYIEGYRCISPEPHSCHPEQAAFVILNEVKDLKQHPGSQPRFSSPDSSLRFGMTEDIRMTEYVVRNDKKASNGRKASDDRKRDRHDRS